MYETHLDIIAAWPSEHALAGDLNLKVATVRAWRNYHRIPPFHHLAVEQAALRRGLGITVEILTRTAPPRGAVGRPKKVSNDSAA